MIDIIYQYISCIYFLNKEVTKENTFILKLIYSIFIIVRSQIRSTCTFPLRTGLYIKNHVEGEGGARKPSLVSEVKYTYKCLTLLYIFLTKIQQLYSKYNIQM